MQTSIESPEHATKLINPMAKKATSDLLKSASVLLWIKTTHNQINVKAFTWGI